MNDPCKEICQLICSEQTFLILSHHRPDGDAIGSQLALVNVLSDLGKEVYAWSDDDVPAKFLFLPNSSSITHPPNDPKDFDVVIAIDTSTSQRLGSALKSIRQKRYFVNIDHHVSNELYGDINWIVPEAPAAGQLAYDLIKCGNFNLTSDIATCLFTAISTDTGSFSFPGTTAKSMHIAGELLDSGANLAVIGHEVYESYPYSRLRLLQMVLAGLKLIDQNRISYCWVTNEMFNLSAAKREDTEGMIDYARAIRGVYVAVLFEELPEPNTVRISLRSKHPKIDVNTIARTFGGGGHQKAAGARISGTSEEVELRVLDGIQLALKQSAL